MNRAIALLLMVALFSGCVQEAEQQKEVPTTSTSIETPTSSTAAPATTQEAIQKTTSSYSTTSSTSATLASTTTSTTVYIRVNNVKADLSLNKGVVHSGEIITMDIKITSERKMTDATVHVYGIYANRFRLNLSKNMDIVPGVNNVSFTYTAPPCNKCSGIAAGKYTIEAEVLYLDKAVARDLKSIEIMQ